MRGSQTSFASFPSGSLFPILSWDPSDEKPEAKRIDQNATGRSQEKSVCSHTFNSQAAQLGQKHGQQDAHKTSKPCWVSGVGRDAIDEVLEESREKKGLRPSPFEEDLWGLC